MTTLLATAQDRWMQWQVRGEPPTSSMLLAMKSEPAKATTAFLLDGRGDSVVVAKVSRSWEGERALQQEAEAARDWHRAGWPVVTATCPKVLDVADGVLWLSALPGRSMLVEYLSAGHLRRRSAVTSDFAAAARWLDDLQEQSRSEPLSLPEVQRVFHDTFSCYLRDVSDARAVRELFSDACDTLTSTCPLGTAATAVHGDFWMGNLLVTRGTVTGVVDLELSSLRGLPMQDVMKLPLSYSLYLDTAGRCRPRPGTWPHLAGFEEVFLGNGHLARTAEAFVRGRMHRLGIAPDSLRAFLPLVIAQQGLLQRHDPVAADGYTQLLCALARADSWPWRSLT